MMGLLTTTNINVHLKDASTKLNLVSTVFSVEKPMQDVTSQPQFITIHLENLFYKGKESLLVVLNDVTHL